jgi:sec-independent protein translocase protein TatA
MDWFSGWHWAIVAVVFLVLFGSSRLPGAAKSLGSSMHIFKRSLREGLNDGDNPAGPASVAQGTITPAAELRSPSSDVARQAQIEDLQRQVQDLQRAAANGDARPVGSQASGEPGHGAQA